MWREKRVRGIGFRVWSGAAHKNNY